MNKLLIKASIEILEESFTKNIPVMKVNRILRKTDPHKSLVNTKSALYNLKDDPGQLNPINDKNLIKKYKELMLREIKSYDPPKELLKNYFKEI